MLYGEMYTNAPSSSPWSYVRTAASRCTRHSALTTAFPKSRFVKIQMSTSDLYRREWLVCTPRDNARCGLLWNSNVTECVAKCNCYPIRSQGEDNTCYQRPSVWFFGFWDVLTSERSSEKMWHTIHYGNANGTHSHGIHELIKKATANLM